MKDKSFFNSNQHEISESLQNFIDSMVEEIVLEGKPFDTQKKYLRKFSENEGLDFNKLEADVTTFIEILDSLKLTFDKLQVKLAEEKGRECHISETTIDKLIKHSSQPKKTKGVTSYGLYGVLCLFLLGLVYFLVSLLSHNDTIPVTPEQQVQITDTEVVIKHDTIVIIQYGTEAEQLYRADAERGDATAQFNLGCYFYSGEKGLSQNYAEAVKWYTKAASQGHTAAQNNLGYCYEKGFGVDEDIEKAKYWYQNAAEQGNQKAKVSLERIEKIEAKAPQKAKALTGTEVGREWVDLGLSVKWATTNLGATTMSVAGDYFAWGEVKPKSEYWWNTYKYTIIYNNPTNKQMDKKYQGEKETLELDDDAAHVNWGGLWRIPTDAEWKELMEKCNWKWEKNGSKYGYKITSKINGKQIFLPTSGYRCYDDPKAWYNKTDGYYMSSSSDVSYISGTVISVNGNNKHSNDGFVYLFFDSKGQHLSSGLRCEGFPIRPVINN